MAQIRNIQGMSVDELNRELQRGGKFVVFHYCVSVIVMTFRRGSDVHFVRAGESTIKHSIGYTFLTFFFGWWGFPWGPIYTISSIFTNLTGGKDVTQEIIYSLNIEQPASSVTNAKTNLSLSENDTRETEEEILKRRAEKEDHSRFMPQ